MLTRTYTHTLCMLRTLDPAWGEDFYLEWGELAAGKRLITLEVWDWDFWRPVSQQAA